MKKIQFDAHFPPCKNFLNFFKKRLAKPCLLCYTNQAVRETGKKFQNAAVAQLDRVFGYEPKGRGFESLQPYQKASVKADAFCFAHSGQAG